MALDYWLPLLVLLASPYFVALGCRLQMQAKRMRWLIMKMMRPCRRQNLARSASIPTRWRAISSHRAILHPRLEDATIDDDGQTTQVSCIICSKVEKWERLFIPKIDGLWKNTWRKGSKSTISQLSMTIFDTLILQYINHKCTVHTCIVPCHHAQCQ